MRLKVTNRITTGKDVIISFETVNKEFNHILPKKEAEAFKLGTVWDGRIENTLVRAGE